MQDKGNDLENLFRMISHMQRNCFDAECKRRGINTAIHPAILLFLRNCSVASQNEIADTLDLDIATMAVSIKELEEAGALQKPADQAGPRQDLVMLTEKGRQMADEVNTVFEDVERSMFYNLSDEERVRLKKLFLHIAENLGSMQETSLEHLLGNRLEAIIMR